MYLMCILALGVSCVISGLVLSNTKSDGNVDMENRINHLEAEIHSTMSVVQQTMDDLQTTKSDLQATKTELQATMTELQATKTELQATKTELQTTKTELESANLELGQNFSKVLDSKTIDVAFQAYLNKSMRILKNQTVKYDGIHYNAGIGYNATTGVFTAPVSGTYFFSAQAELYKKNTAQPQGITQYIQQSGRTLSEGFVATSSTLDDLTTTTIAISHVRQGEQVYVRFTHDAEIYADSNQQTIFNGALLSVH